MLTKRGPRQWRAWPRLVAVSHNDVSPYGASKSLLKPLDSDRLRLPRRALTEMKIAEITLVTSRLGSRVVAPLEDVLGN